MNEKYLAPAASICAELLRQWSAVNSGKQAPKEIVASCFEEAYSGIVLGMANVSAKKTTGNLENWAGLDKV